MRSRPREFWIALACSVAAAVAMLLACFASQDGTFNASALVKLSSQEPLAATARASDPSFTFVHPVEHYDGVYYYAIARDPLMRGVEHQLIDQAAYRYGHPMLGWLAGALALGRPQAIPDALLFLSLSGGAIAAYAISRLSVSMGRTPWGGLLVACSPGLLYAATVSTSEPLGAALMATSLLAWTKRRIALSAGLLALLCLTKESYVTVPAGLALWEGRQWIRTRTRPEPLAAVVAALAVGPLALLAWQAEVKAHLGSWPGTGTAGNIAAPIQGWLNTFSYAHLLSAGNADQSEIGAIVGPVLIAVAVVLLAASANAARLRTPLDGVLLGMVILTSALSYVTLAYPHELLRNPSVVLLLATGVLLSRPNALPTPASYPSLTVDDVGKL